MMATSTSPCRSASAHCEGTVNERSYLPSRGPSANPHTSGAVFKYSTIEMRSLLIILSCPPNLKYSTPEWPAFQAGILPRGVAHGVARLLGLRRKPDDFVFR